MAEGYDLNSIMERWREETARSRTSESERRRQEAEAEKRRALGESWVEYGASRTLADAAASDSPLARDVANVLAHGMGLGADPKRYQPVNVLQVNELADRLFRKDRDGETGLERATGLFGEAVPDFVRFVMDTHKSSGGDTRSFDTLLEIASAMMPETASGAELVRKLQAGYARFLPSVVSGASAGGRQAGDIALDDIDPHLRHRADAILAKTARTFRNNGASVAGMFDDPRLRTSVQTAMGLADWLSGMGVNTEAEFKARGRSFSDDAGDFVYATQTGTQSPNLVRHLMDQQVAFGNMHATPEGQESLGCQSLLASLQRGLFKFAKADLFSGGSIYDTVRAAFADGSEGGKGTQMLDAVAGEMAKSFGGKGGDVAARVLAYDALAQFLDTGSFDMKSLVDQLAFRDEEFQKRRPEAAATLQSWARFNSVRSLDSDKWTATLTAHFQELGLPRDQAAVHATRVMEDAGRIAAIGQTDKNGNTNFNFMAPIMTALAQENVYVPVKDQNGKHAVHAITNRPMWTTVLADGRYAMDEAGITDPDEWRNRQAEAKRDTDLNNRADEAKARSAGTAAGKQTEDYN